MIRRIPPLTPLPKSPADSYCDCVAVLGGRAAAVGIGVRLTCALLVVTPGTAFGAPRSNPEEGNSSLPVATSAVPELHWNAPQGCPSDEQFKLRVGDYLGRDVRATTTATAIPATTTATAIPATTTATTTATAIPATTTATTTATAIPATTTATTTVTAARIDVTRDGEDYRISLQVEQHGRWRTRALRTKTCAEALDASALVIALAIDPSVATRMPSSSGPSENPSFVQKATSADTASHPDSVPHHSSIECLWVDPIDPPCHCPSQSLQPRVALVAARVSVKPRYASSGRYALSVYSGVQISYQQLPTVPVGVGLGASFDTSHLRLSFTALASQAVARQGTKGGEFSLIRAQVDACWISSGRFGIGPCTGLSLGALSGEGIGVKVVQRATELWWASRFGAVLRYWHRDSAIAGAFTFVELPGRRPSFQLSGSEFYRPPAVGLVGGVLVGLIVD